MNKKQSMKFEDFRGMTGKLKKYPYLYRNCRNCVNYLRVKQLTPISMQGFCRLGRGCGDFDLYVSTSDSQHCRAFLFSRKHAQIKLFEDYLNELLHKETWRREGRIFAKAFKAEIDIRGVMLARDVIYRNFRQKHSEDFEKLRDMCEFDEKSYRKFLDIMTVMLQDWIGKNQSNKFN